MKTKKIALSVLLGGLIMSGSLFAQEKADSIKKASVEDPKGYQQNEPVDKKSEKRAAELQKAEKKSRYQSRRN